MKELPQNYEAITTEKKWQKEWHRSGVYNWSDKVARVDSYVIDTPPPTVSGSLHMGHIYSYTQADFIARFQRMIGKNVFYPMGFDDNGLPTERLVEKTKKTKAHLHSREDFIKMCNEVAEGARKDFRNLFESIALSVDWNQEYYTISDESRRISQMSFLDLYKKNEVYRSYRPTYWDWIDQTAIAQAEVEEKELEGIQIVIPFGIMDKKDWDKYVNNDNPRPSFDSLEKKYVMTTRPELLGSCVALMCHESVRADYENKVAVSPLFNVVVPICFDEKVDKEKGTGFVMCCSWGDDTDKEWISKNDLPWRPLVDLDGKLRINGTGSNNENITSIIFKAGKDSSRNGFSALSNNNCFDVHKALKHFEKIEGKKLIRDIKNENSAKGVILKLLEEENLLQQDEKTGEKILHKKQMVKCAERSGCALETIPTNQWFIEVVKHKDDLKKKADECIWRPDFMKHRIHQWIDGLNQDWCISRQRYFGVPFPVWFSKRAGEEGKIIVADVNKLPVNPLVDLPEGYTKDEVIPEADVMDTWATSSVSPQLSSKAINKDFAVDYNRHQKLFPADLRPQAHEIIRTWAFYTIVKAHLHENSIPWKNLMISGWCLAEDKSKMSKSKGNVVTPVEIIAENSADVVRYWASTSRLGADTAFSKDVLKIGRKLSNKLWNATKFAAIFLPLIEKEPVSAADDIAKGIITEPLDKWAISRLAKTIEVATKEFENYEYSMARMAVEDFFWNVFCDNYLEAVKGRYYDESPENKQKRFSAIHTIYHCLDGILRLFAPIMPHVTEELYSHIFEEKTKRTKNNSIHSSGFWPSAKDYVVDEEAELQGRLLVEILNEVRKVKADKNVSVKYPVDKIEIINADEKSIRAFETDLRNVTSAKDIIFSAGTEVKINVTLAEKAEIA